MALNGQPARWDGRALEMVADRIQELGKAGLAPIDWSSRGTVRIAAADPGRTSQSFFVATTSSEWYVALRFYVPRKTFRIDALQAQLKLAPFHETDTPVLCDLPRVRLSDRGAFQEVAIVAHAADELDSPGFAAFLKTAVAAYVRIGMPARLRKASELTG